MSGFVIFALVLTFVYVVYFAVMITLDLHGKKDEKKTEEETYDVGDHLTSMTTRLTVSILKTSSHRSRSTPSSSQEELISPPVVPSITVSSWLRKRQKMAARIRFSPSLCTFLGNQTNV